MHAVEVHGNVQRRDVLEAAVEAQGVLTQGRGAVRSCSHAAAAHCLPASRATCREPERQAKKSKQVF